MEEKDMVVGNYYTLEYCGSKTDLWIIKYTGKLSDKNFAVLCNNSRLFNYLGSMDGGFKNWRDSTTEEIQHLEVCKKENKFIPWEEAKKLFNKELEYSLF